MSVRRRVTVRLGGAAIPVQYARLGRAVQPAARRFVRAQSHEPWIAREARRPPAPMLEVRAHHEPEERLAAAERPAPALPVTAPQLLVVTDALHRAPPQPPELDCER